MKHMELFLAHEVVLSTLAAVGIFSGATAWEDVTDDTMEFTKKLDAGFKKKSQKIDATMLEHTDENKEGKGRVVKVEDEWLEELALLRKGQRDEKFDTSVNKSYSRRGELRWR